jgi:asparagine synthase (glutamine-hydrolysing)
LAAKDVTVVLCGQGGDELFAGYQTFDLLLNFLDRDKKWDRLPSTFRNALFGLYTTIPGQLKKFPLAESIDRFLFWYGSFIKKYSTLRMELTEKEKRQLYSNLLSQQLNGTDSHTIYQRYYDQLAEDVSPINKVSYLDLKVHLGDVLMRDVDVMSMAFSLETRIPLIDHRLVEFVATIPPELKLKNGQKKYIFIEAIKDLLPQEVLDRPKLGFAFPFPIWLRGQLRPLVDFVLSRENIERRGLFNYDMVNRLKQDFYSGKNIRYRKIWGLVILELWLRLARENDHQFFEQLNSKAAILDD